eukprot:scaffold3120_cov73-Cylindrotheca_fusiformis.AAC.1
MIAKYVPADLWLYEYAKRLFEARYDHFINGINEYVHPELPPLPNFTDDDPLDSFPDQCGDRKSGDSLIVYPESKPLSDLTNNATIKDEAKTSFTELKIYSFD